MADKITTAAIALDDLLELSRSRLERVAPEDLRAEVDEGALLVDTRTTEQRERDGEMPGSYLIDLTVLEWRLAPSSDYRRFTVPPLQRVILVCTDGYSSSLAACRLQDLGLVNATDLEGGFRAWKRWSQRTG